MEDEKTTQACSLWRALDVIGDVPTILILESAFLRITRFDGFLTSTGILRTLLSNRLKTLCDAKCMEKVAYSEKPRRYEYRLTEKGRDIYGAALMMLRWEQKWGRQSGKIEVHMRHKTCGEICIPTPSCGSCHEEVDARAVRWQEGPGFTKIQIDYHRRRRQSGSTRKRQNETTLFDTISAVIGDRWSMLVLRAVFTSITTFDEIRKDSGIATNILAGRLKTLTSMGILEKQAYQHKPTRYRYKLTESGRDIYPIQLEILKWGDRHYANKEGPPLLLFHKNCDKELNPKICCNMCGAPLVPEEVDFEVTEPGFTESQTYKAEAVFAPELSA